MSHHAAKDPPFLRFSAADQTDWIFSTEKNSAGEIKSNAKVFLVRRAGLEPARP